jgi:Flp pilus assembly pilin Flp
MQKLLHNKKAKSQRGASMIEYALLVALIALIAIPAVGALGGSVRTKFVEAKQEIAGEGSIVECNAQHPDWPNC